MYPASVDGGAQRRAQQIARHLSILVAQPEDVVHFISIHAAYLQSDSRDFDTAQLMQCKLCRAQLRYRALLSNLVTPIVRQVMFGSWMTYLFIVLGYCFFFPFLASEAPKHASLCLLHPAKILQIYVNCHSPVWHPSHGFHRQARHLGPRARPRTCALRPQCRHPRWQSQRQGAACCLQAAPTAARPPGWMGLEQ